MSAWEALLFHSWSLFISHLLLPFSSRRCWTRSEGHHGEKIKNGSFASDHRSFHISRCAIKIPEEIVWYGHYWSFSAFKRYNMRCSFEIFLRNGGRNRRLLLASRNCCFLCRRDNFRDRNNAVRINTSFLHVVKVLDFERKLLFSALLTSDFFPGTLTCAWRILIFSSKIMCNLFWFSRGSWSARQKVESYFANLLLLRATES